MKKIEDLYDIYLMQNNIIYSIDKIRLKTYISYDKYSNLDFYLRTYHNDKIDYYKISDRIMQFKYNYSIKVGEGQSFYLGFHHNNEKHDEHDGLYNLTVEFNPNKLKKDRLLMYILNLSGQWYLKRYDLAMDLQVNILDLITDLSGKYKQKVFSNGFDDKTIYFGVGDGHVKIYNKKIESKLDIIGNLTRVEITREVEDFEIRKVKALNYDNNFPSIYTNNYMFSFSDYTDKTLLPILYAIQNGYPIRDLTKTYRKKIRDLLEGGYKIKFDNKTVTDLLRRVIFHYFMENNLVVWW